MDYNIERMKKLVHLINEDERLFEHQEKIRCPMIEVTANRLYHNRLEYHERMMQMFRDASMGFVWREGEEYQGVDD